MGNIYTLADNGTNKTGQNDIIVTGKGSDLSNIRALEGRAKRKTITQIMMLNLISIAQENGDPELEKSYWNTYYCQQNIITADGRLYGKYCKNRFCTLCCANRKAEMINKYHPIMKHWKEPCFLTLTVKSCMAHQLKGYIKIMFKTFQKITEKYRKRYQRGKGLKLVGIKSLESNFNPKTSTYNPHFHIITKDKWMADVIKIEWIKRSKKGYAVHWCQKIIPITNLETGLMEIIKYGSKIFTEPDLKNKAKQTDTAQIYLKALDTILVAMKGERIFDRFGFNAPNKTKSKHTSTKLLKMYNEWEYDIETSDWINTMTNEVLTNYKIPSHLQAILDCNINTTLT